jgi:hypothetical protein
MNGRSSDFDGSSDLPVDPCEGPLSARRLWRYAAHIGHRSILRKRGVRSTLRDAKHSFQDGSRWPADFHTSGVEGNRPQHRANAIHKMSAGRA